jgi:dTDP-4-amino-4,6-dideoxygalactose transaminase
MPLPPLALTSPEFGDAERDSVLSCLDRGYLSPGDYVQTFERMWAATLQARHCVAVSSGTAALMTVLDALRERRTGSIVVTATYTCAPTYAAAVHAGCKVAVVDAEPRRLGMEPAMLDEVLTELGPANVLAVVPVHVYGAPVDPDVFQVCFERGVPVIEDAAEAHGAWYEDGRLVGHTGLAGCFSFRGDKIITTGGTGGAVVTDDEELAAAVRARRDLFLRVGEWTRYDATGLGFGCQMSNLQGAFGAPQIGRLGRLVAHRQRIAQAYRVALRDMPVAMPADVVGHVYWRFCVSPTSAEPAEVAGALRERGIETIAPFTPMHVLPFHERHGAGSPRPMRCSEHLWRTGICLPIGPNVTVRDVMRVADALDRALVLCAR